MKNIECNLPDINFNINVDEKNYEMVIKKINESIIPFKKNTEKTIIIEYIVDSKRFYEMLNLINDSLGIFYDSFKNQKHKEVKLNNEYYYLVDTQEYIGNKIDDEHYKIIVKENTETSANWIVRIIREIEEEIGIELKKEEGHFLGTIQKENYFRDVWKFKRDISSKDIFYNDGEVIDSKWVLLDEYVDLYNNGEIAPSGDFIIKMLKEKELEEER